MSRSDWSGAEQDALARALHTVLGDGGSFPLDADAAEALATLSVLLVGRDAPVLGLPPIGPVELASALVDPTHRHLAAQLLVLTPFVRSPAERFVAVRAEDHCRALVSDGELAELHAARDLALARATAHLFRRCGLGPPPADALWGHPADHPVEDPRMAAHWRSLAELPDGSLGAAFVAFCRRHGAPLPGEPGAPPLALGLHQHDLAHVVTGCGTDRWGETRLALMQAGGRGAASWIAAGASLLEVRVDGPSPDLSRPAVRDGLREALEAGRCLRVDLSDPASFDLWSHARRPLAEVRAELGLDVPAQPSTRAEPLSASFLAHG